MMNQKEYKKGFDTYFTNYGILIPWRSNLKMNDIEPRENEYSFSIDRVKFKRNTFSKDSKLYFKRIMNNGFVNEANRVNKRVLLSNSKENNIFFTRYFSNYRRLFKVKTDYSINFDFVSIPETDTINLNIKYFSKKGKQLNLFKPTLLETNYKIDKNIFEAGNHLDMNIFISSTISKFILNNTFIRF
jgi:hypothetical protein